MEMSYRERFMLHGKWIKTQKKSFFAMHLLHLKAGQSKEVVLKLGVDAFEFFAPETNTMRTDPMATYEIFYGTSSKDSDLKKL